MTGTIRERSPGRFELRAYNAATGKQVTMTYAHPRKEKRVGIAEAKKQPARLVADIAEGKFGAKVATEKVTLSMLLEEWIAHGETRGRSPNTTMETEALVSDPPRVESWKFRFHDLRHLSATEMVGQGMDPRTVAARLGHANPSVTLAVYAHAVKARDREATDGSVASSAYRTW
jgi:hypothetical protein